MVVVLLRGLSSLEAGLEQADETVWAAVVCFEEKKERKNGQLRSSGCELGRRLDPKPSPALTTLRGSLTTPATSPVQTCGTRPAAHLLHNHSH